MHLQEQFIFVLNRILSMDFNEGVDWIMLNDKKQITTPEQITVS